MMIQFGIKDALDVLLVAALLFWLYKLMKQSGTKNIFLGVLSFIAVWLVTSEILGMRLTGTILDKFMSIGLLVLVIIFQEQIKRFLEEVGSHRRWHLVHKFLHRRRDASQQASDSMRRVMPIVYACMNMARSRTGALIVIEQVMNLDSYEKTGDMIDANINTRLIENIFFKNSPLHDGAMIIADNRIKAAGCILPVSHDSNIPRSLGLRHRSALGIAQATDAVAIVVSEETGGISIAHRGVLTTHISSTDLEHRLTHLELDS
ncbi:MAG: diadenylate cyclase CdaA [Muribaculaceae bacterium]|nr:diadenylate cyclase CdaA [Muribaculaceae bacterium]MDE5912597.1 diadenylate cyclase CdaA [Muribaculaceae bacterium]MDE5972252.1 diadenylate cyclase CdaA [Muribaculaceae bacterium]MDE6462358.1 diadenylate cyclase CdaA [Muribaculaceae bacterium]MDE6510314.1 diadenylate cyclase CdaA [Muribaculaceae bacterium]